MATRRSQPCARWPPRARLPCLLDSSRVLWLASRPVRRSLGRSLPARRERPTELASLGRRSLSRAEPARSRQSAVGSQWLCAARAAKSALGAKSDQRAPEWPRLSARNCSVQSVSLATLARSASKQVNESLSKGAAALMSEVSIALYCSLLLSIALYRPSDATDTLCVF